MRLPTDVCSAIPVRHVCLDVRPDDDPPSPSYTVYWRGDRPMRRAAAFTADARGRPVDIRSAPDLDEPGRRDVPLLQASVVICTRDRPDQLSRALASFAGQSLTPAEIIVVDNASRDGRTREVALAAGVRFLREDRPGLDIARNTGAAAARFPLVVYTDDDTVLHPEWLRRMVAAFDGPEIWAVTGQVLPAELETPAQAVFEKAWGLGKGDHRRDYDARFYRRTRDRGCPVWDIGAGASMAFRRDAMERLGGFDERLDVGAAGCSGDSEYWYRVLHAGGVCRYEPSAVVFHYHRREFDSLAGQVRAYMRGHVAALLVQFERTGDAGNLRRLFLTLPKAYVRKLGRRLAGVHDSSTCLVGEEIRGVLEGVGYYLWASLKRSRRAAPLPSSDRSPAPATVPPP